MIITRSALSVSLMLLLGVSLTSQAQSLTVQKPATAGSGYVPNRILVQPAPDATPQQFENVLKQFGAETKEVLPRINVHVVELPLQADERAVAALLNHNPHIQFAELDTLSVPNTAANDTYYSIAWHLTKTQTPQAWDQIWTLPTTSPWDSSLGKDVTVAIIDSGIYAAHPDLQGKVLPGWNVVSNNSDTSDIAGHGTGVAGSVSVVSNNSRGATSVAWNAKLLPVRITNSTDGSSSISYLAAAITWAADNGARIANVSYSGPCGGSSTILSAAQYMRSKNGIVIASAGNNAMEEMSSPSDAVLCVGATDSNDTLASFSSYGSYVDLTAPGVNIVSLNTSGGYSYWLGTSFSSPVVSAVAALVVAANPLLSPSQVDYILTSTADDLGAAGYDIYYGAGRVNAAKAVAQALNTSAADTQAPSVVINNPLSSSTVKGAVAVDVSASDNVEVAKVDLFVNGKLWATSTTAPHSFAWDTTTSADGMVSLVANAWDNSGNMAASKAISVKVSNVIDVQAPTVTFTSPSNGSKLGNSTTVSISANDNVGVDSITLSINGKTVMTVTGGNTLTYKWSTRKVSAGTHVLTAVAKDAAGNSTTTSINVTK